MTTTRTRKGHGMNHTAAAATKPEAIELPRGSYSRVARRLRPKVSPQFVREVALGNKTSARVRRAVLNFAAELHERGGFNRPPQE
jgi:hypothetical protein